MSRLLASSINQSEKNIAGGITRNMAFPIPIRMDQKTAVQKMLAGKIAAIENGTAQDFSPIGKLEIKKEQNSKTKIEKIPGNIVGPLARRLPTQSRIRLGIEEIDRRLDTQNGQGIVAAGLHEIYSPTTLSFSSALGFGLVLGNHLARQNLSTHGSFLRNLDGPKTSRIAFRGSIFWIGDNFCLSEGGGFYGPGLHALGIMPERIIHVRVTNAKEAIWAAGEIARSTGAAFSFLEVRGNPPMLDLATTRRLLLRCQRANSSLFILRQGNDRGGNGQASAASTRWRITPWRSCSEPKKNGQPDFDRMTRWRVELEKCRGGRPGQWILEWNHHEQTLQSVTPEQQHGKTAVEATLSGNQSAAVGERPHRTKKMGNVVALERAS